MPPLVFHPPETDLPWPIDTVEIALAGDLMMHGGEIAAARRPDGSYAMPDLFEAVAPYLRGADLACANLETNVAGEDLGGYSGYPAFNSPPVILDEAKKAGFDVLQTVNNHCMDRGAEGDRRTIEAVDKYGFLHTGTYRTPADRDRPWAMTSVGGLKVAVVSYAYGTERPVDAGWRVNLIEELSIARDIRSARAAGADLVVVGLHWGTEYHDRPNPDQVELAHRLVAWGADVVWGQHPHVIQPAEVVPVDDGAGGVREGLVLYSLGNFVSNQRPPPRDGGVIVRLDVARDRWTGRTWLDGVRFTPTWVDDRDDDGRAAFHVLPTAPSPWLCASRDPGDCERIDAHKAHAATIFPAEDLDWSLERPARDAILGWSAVPDALGWWSPR